MQQITNDHAYMAEALRLAQKGLFTVRVNPRVGCVLVKQGKIIGSGYHARHGQSHAEVNALNSATENVENATAYVTLEPCTHQGNTPPCVEPIVAARVARVVVATRDPNPLVNGKGLEYLKQHGIETRCHVLEKDAQELNRGFIKRIIANQPYVTVKTAISMDGRTALTSGESKWITGEHARLDVQKLRASSCAILTGIETILYDDPSLTVRLSRQDLGIEEEFEQPARVILDTSLRFPETAKVLKSPGKVIVYTCSDNDEKSTALRRRNVEVTRVNMSANRVELESVMHDLASRGINEVWTEAGATLTGSLLEQNLVDKMIIYMAPCLIGDSDRGLARLSSITTMRDQMALKIEETRFVGNDIRITAKPLQT